MTSALPSVLFSVFLYRLRSEVHHGVLLPDLTGVASGSYQGLCEVWPSPEGDARGTKGSKEDTGSSSHCKDLCLRFLFGCDFLHFEFIISLPFPFFLFLFLLLTHKPQTEAYLERIQVRPDFFFAFFPLPLLSLLFCQWLSPSSCLLVCSNNMGL